MLYVIDYCNGFVEEVDCVDLEAAKEEAVKGMRYTQSNVQIKSAEGEVLSTSHWWSVEPTEDDVVLERFGSYGFYGDWID